MRTLLLMRGAPGAGKAQPDESLILTPKGYVSIKNIQEGDELFGEDGKIHKVVKKFDRGERKIYKITFKDSTNCLCCNEHLWTVIDKKIRNPKNRTRTLQLEEILNSELRFYKGDEYKRWRYEIPITKPLEFSSKPVKIPPYILGVLLGDGTLSQAGIHLSLNYDDQYEMIEYMNLILPEEYVFRKINSKKDGEYLLVIKEYNLIKKGNKRLKNIFKTYLKEYNLLGTNSFSKFIPEEYKYNSIENRLELLRGLMDTDGYINTSEKARHIEYSTTSYQLALDLAFLVHSFGGTCTIKKRKPKFYNLNGEKKQGSEFYNCYLKMPSEINPFKTSRKSNCFNFEPQKPPYRTIRKIEYVGEKHCFCIMTDNPTGLYLTDNCIVTHNTTWIKNQGLENYTISPDEIRMMYSSPKMTVEGDCTISQEMDNQVWETVFRILESRMERGEFTVIDATNSKTKDMQRYKDLCDYHRYKIFCVDFTDVPLETCLAQNKMRDRLKFVPEIAIKNIYSRFETQKIPSGITVIKRDEFDKVLEKPFDLSEYKKIVHIGDIHGSYDTLMQYFKEFPFNDEYEYIFTGDYLDRGNQNAEVFRFLDGIKNKPNVCLLTGNHERHINAFGREIEAQSKEFERRTKIQLLNDGITPKDARMFYRKLRQCSYYKYKDKVVLACHGGIPSLGKNLLYVPTQDLINGVGDYPDYKDIAENWFKNTKENEYLIHGHRNIAGDEINISDRVFNLEGGVEFGGELRIVELNEDGTFTCRAYDNCQPKTDNEVVLEKQKVLTVEDAITLMKANRFIEEKELGNNISSFNFSRLAFEKKNWNNQTILARGLFINVKEKEIVARSYEKFFRINERPETSIMSLGRKLKFPVTAYVKENGYLGIVSYNKYEDDLFVASKSTNKGDFALKIKELIETKYDKEKLINYLKDKNETLVFEVELPHFDPHIIEYTEDRLILLDAVENTLEFKKKSFEELKEISKEINIPHKRLATVFYNWDEFYKFYVNVDTNEDYQFNGEYIEGFVFEDANGFMVKMKTNYYNLWKHLRGVADSTLKRGYITKTGQLTTPLENKFYAFCKDLYNNYYDRDSKTYPFETDIISLRKGFENGSC